MSEWDGPAEPWLNVLAGMLAIAAIVLFLLIVMPVVLA
jgi:hypothetical protein